MRSSIAVIGIVIVALLAAGCSGVSVVGYPLENGKHLIQRTVSDPHAFAPTTQRSWLEICDKRTEQKPTPSGQMEEIEHYENCERDGQVQFTTTNGYLDGLGAAALYSGAIVGGAYFIGKGLGDSGTTVNQAGGGANATGGNAAGGSSASISGSISQSSANATAGVGNVK